MARVRLYKPSLTIISSVDDREMRIIPGDYETRNVLVFESMEIELVNASSHTTRFEAQPIRS